MRHLLHRRRAERLPLSKGHGSFYSVFDGEKSLTRPLDCDTFEVVCG